MSGEPAGTSEAAVAEAGQEESGAADPRDAIIAALRERVVTLGKADRCWVCDVTSCRRIGPRMAGGTVMPDPSRPPLLAFPQKMNWGRLTCGRPTSASASSSSRMPLMSSDPKSTPAPKQKKWVAFLSVFLLKYLCVFCVNIAVTFGFMV